jgi:hypothetical protein
VALRPLEKIGSAIFLPLLQRSGAGGSSGSSSGGSSAQAPAPNCC